MKYYVRQVKKFAKGDIIFSENSPCDGMYIIDSGRVRVFKTMGTGADKKEIDLCILGQKAMFGEMGMIDESPRSASVQALETVACTVITKQIFEDQLGKIPPWMVNMIRILVSRLRETNEKLKSIIEDQAGQTVNEDIAAVMTVEEGEPGSSLTTHSLMAESERIIESLFSKEPAAPTP